jgi:hypothetical protein
MADKPIWVPIALPEDEARATFNALRSIFASLTAMGEIEASAPVARAMYAVGKACDEAREKAIQEQ